MKAPLPSNESQRLKALERYKILDTEIEDAYCSFHKKGDEI